MHPHADLLTTFYTAFQQRDAATMARCYHPDSTFHDPAFGDLDHDATVAMWTMLCARGKDLQLSFEIEQADDEAGRVHWEPRYTYRATGRPVHNRIDATFTFRDGLIMHHRDVFDLRRWCAMALGPVGKLLGWAPPFQAMIRKKARAALAAFRSKRGEDLPGERVAG